jgi:hypothetical protein
MKLRDPRNVTLDRVTFHEDHRTLSYRFTLDGEDRIISYRSEGEGDARVGVRDKMGGEPIIQLLAGRGGVRARTRAGEFKLTNGKLLLPPDTDWRWLWLLVQNPLANLSLAPHRIYNQALNVRVPGRDEPEPESFASWGGFVDILGGLFDPWGWFGGGEDCLDPGKEAECTETDAEGNSSQITFKCDCGTPMCNAVTTTVDMPAIVTDSSTGETSVGTVQRTITMCACFCMELTISTGTRI